MSSLSSDSSYKDFLLQVKQRIKEAQVKAMVTVNREMILLYREIGKSILDRQEQADWGDKIVDQLASDLKKEFPGMKWFSRRNLLYMRQFASTYPDISIVQEVLAQISRYHNVTLLQKTNTEKERLRYAHKSIENGWSRNIMVHQIELWLFKRQGKAVTNFSTTLPSPQSDMAKDTLKDPYVFDFLSLSERAKEKELEDALVQHITSFLLELGKGFAFIGRQYRLAVGDEDFAIDLLFYHLKLRSYIAVDLKIGSFKPEYAGKMNFYLSALDDLVKTDHDSLSIGIILCKEKDSVRAEYSLRGINKPIGISEYQLTQTIPDEFQSQLPTVEELEEELEEIEDATNQ